MSNDKHTDLLKAIHTLSSQKDVDNFLKDLLTPAEIEEFATRFRIAKLLWTTTLSYKAIATQVGTSTTTVTRVARFLYKEKNQGYKKILQHLFPQQNP